jgi:hypothetical protein
VRTLREHEREHLKESPVLPPKATPDDDCPVEFEREPKRKQKRTKESAKEKAQQVESADPPASNSDDLRRITHALMIILPTAAVSIDSETA